MYHNMLPHARRVAKVSLVAHCNCNADWCLNSNGMPDSRLQAISSKWEALEAAAVVLAHVLGVAVSPKLLSIL